MPVQPYLVAAVVALVVIAAINDLATRRIPNRLLLFGFLVALPLHALSPTPAAVFTSCLAGAAMGLAIFLPFYLLRGMAAGDVKLMATVGAFTGPLAVLQIAVVAWCVGGVMALAIMVFKGRIKLGLANLRTLLRPWFMRLAGMPAVAEPLPRQQSAGSMPYGVAIALATLVVVHTGGL